MLEIFVARTIAMMLIIVRHWISMPTSKKTLIPLGTTFNSLTVIHLVGTVENKRVYLCRCQCGNKVKAIGSRLKNGHIKSCGCAKICSREHTRGAGFAAILAAYRSLPASRKYGWKLSSDEFYEITQKNCRYCGCPPANISKKSQSNGRSYTYNGIDRINSYKGYWPENVVPCCKQCNFAKRLMSQKDFMSFITRIYALHFS